MCGRINVIDDPLCQLVSDVLGINFATESNPDLCPSQKVATIIQPGHFQQLNADWGLNTHWQSSLLINARAEQVASKPTFKDAFVHSRCLVPCSGWYEWKSATTDNKAQKQKYLFSHSDNEPFYMAGILFNPESPQLVTLTTQAKDHCNDYHHRMPVLIPKEEISAWFDTPSHQLDELMHNGNTTTIKVAKVA